MAEFNFYGTWKDSINLLNQLIRSGPFRLIADIAYSDARALEISSTSDDLLEAVRITHHLYVWSDSYSRYPIRFGKRSSHGEITINQLESGPCISMYLPDEYRKDGKLRVGRGDIQYPPYFVNPTTNTTYPPPDELKKSFRFLKALIQKKFRKKYWQPLKLSPYGRPSSIEPIWIGDNALELLKTGNYYIKYGQDAWFTISDLHDG